MQVLYLFVVALGYCFCESSDSVVRNSTEAIESYDEDPPQLDGRIIGGSPANIYQFPYQISLQYSGQHICGGSIIHRSYILTAAHCVDGQQSRKFSIRAGSTYTFGGGVISRVCSVTMHSSYNKHTQNNDIALLKLCEALPIGDGVQTVGLPQQNEALYAGSTATVSGWGYTSEGAAHTTRSLQQVQVPVVELSLCQKLYRGSGYVTENMLCAGETAQGGKDSCQGDSGGPLVWNGRLIGIVSWGYGCARPRYPGVYTRVSNYRNWIKYNTNI